MTATINEKVAAYVILRTEKERIDAVAKKRKAIIDADMELIANSLRRDLDASIEDTEKSTIPCSAGTVFYTERVSFKVEDRDALEAAIAADVIEASVFSNSLTKSEVEAYIEKRVEREKRKHERMRTLNPTLPEWDDSMIQWKDVLPPGVGRQVYQELSVRKTQS